MRAPGGATFGEYTVVRRLGVGTMAEVYLCQLEFDDPVVIRRIRPELLPDPELIELFLDEARVAASIEHQNIVQIRDIVEAAGMPYIVMEYVRGPTLARVMRAVAGHTPPYYGELALIVAAIGRGLDHAHTLKSPRNKPLDLVHGEVSIRNIVVSDEGVPKLLDFGVARARARLAESGPPADPSSTDYLAPEQLRGGPVDHRADVYALGACLYHATTGRLPFAAAGPSKRELLAARRAGHFPRPSQVLADYPADLERIVMLALEEQADERIPTAGAMASMLVAMAAAPRMTRRKNVAEFVDHLLLDFDEPLTFGSDDGYASKVVARAGSVDPVTPQVPPAVRQRRKRLMVAAVIGAAMLGGVAAGALIVRGFGHHAPAGHKLAAGPRALLPDAGARPLQAAPTIASAADSTEPPVPAIAVAPADPAPPVVTPIAPPVTAPAPPPVTAVPPVATRPVLGMGRLTVLATVAGATVSIDDNRAGRAPLRRRAVPAGVHFVTVQRDGFTPQRQRVNVLPGKDTWLTVDLVRPRPDKRLAVQAPPEPAAAVRAPEPAPAPRAPEPAPPIARAPDPQRDAAVAAPPPTPRPVVVLAPTPPPAPKPKPVEVALKAVTVPTPLYLPASYAVRSEGELDKILAKIEREAVTIGKAPASIVKGVTHGLGQKLRGSLAGPAVEIHPVEIYTVIVRGALQGRTAGSIAGALMQFAH